MSSEVTEMIVSMWKIFAQQKERLSAQNGVVTISDVVLLKQEGAQLLY